MNITFREYKDEDKEILLDLGKKLDAHVKVMDPLRRIKNLPGFAELALKDNLEKCS